MKRYASAAIGLSVTGVFLYFAVRKVSLAELALAASSIDPRWLPGMIAIVVADLLVRSLRWQLLFKGAKGTDGQPAVTPVLTLLKLEAIGLAMNNVVFLRLGEFTRAYLAGVELKVSGVYALATVLVERALDMMALLSLFVIAAGFVPETVPPPLRAAAALAVTGLGIGLVAVSWLDYAVQRGGARWLGRLPVKLQAIVHQLALGSRALRSPDALLGSIALSLTLWLVDAGVYWMAGRAMGIVPEIGYGRSVVVLSTAAAASAMPTAPGAFGTYEQFVKALLVSWQVPEATALAYAGVIHLLFYLVVTFFGLVCLYRMGHTLESLGRAAKQGLA